MARVLYLGLRGEKSGGFMRGCSLNCSLLIFSKETQTKKLVGAREVGGPVVLLHSHDARVLHPGLGGERKGCDYSSTPQEK